jgi:hypothetical protein
VQTIDGLNLKRSKLIGFYWLNEGVDELDHPMIKAVAAHIHIVKPESNIRIIKDDQKLQRSEPPLILMWIPSFRASFKVDFGGWRQWRDIGYVYPGRSMTTVPLCKH